MIRRHLLTGMKGGVSLVRNLVQTKLLDYEAARGEYAETDKGVAALLYMAFELWIAVYALGYLGSGMMSHGITGSRSY
jgi:hypothetical protein